MSDVLFNVLPEPLLYLLAGLLIGLTLSAAVAALLLRKSRQSAAELEHQLRSHSFELQITLDELAEKNHLLEQQSRIDSLSGCFNRAHFDQQMRSEIKRSRREQRPLALVLLDIDHFKHINDTLGHLAGDQAITAVAEVIKAQLKRPADKVCRYGGEEFALILPATTRQGAEVLAESIRSALHDTRLVLTQKPYQLTLSAGCFAAIASADSDNDEFIRFADQALYQAKHNGRNQVQSYPPVLATEATATGALDEH